MLLALIVVFVLFCQEVDLDTYDSCSLSSRTSVLSKSQRFDRHSSSQQKDSAADVDDIDKMKVAEVSFNN